MNHVWIVVRTVRRIEANGIQSSLNQILSVYTDLEAAKAFVGVISRSTELEKAAKVMNLSSDVYTILSEPKNELIVHFPVRMDDGRYALFKGYRVYV